MARVPRILPDVSHAIREFNLPRETMLQLIARLHSELRSESPTLRNRRDLEEPDRMFLHRIYLADDDYRYTFEFAVDDATSPDHYLVKGVTCIKRPSF
jgi:hypothetical protein